MQNLENILEQIEFSKEDLIFLLSLEKESEIKKLFKKAYEVKEKQVGTKVYFRGIVEFSNICDKNCYYCGIRKSNSEVNRFMMQISEITEAAKWCYDANYGSMVLQSGERNDDYYIDFVEELLKEIKNVSENNLGITISLGEQSLETYKRWYKAGAHRYLLRIESSNPEIYRSLHPEDHDFDKRVKSLKDLREAGFQVGTGVMIGLPNQTIEDLANDIIFFKENDIDMIGMGPYIPHHSTPMKDSLGDFEQLKERQLMLGLKMIAVTRLYLKDVNIASTTALQALKSDGREMGLEAGANIVMPNITDTKYRNGYQLYDNKPCMDENSSMCRDCLGKRVESIGETIGFNEWGDSPHFQKRKEK